MEARLFRAALLAAAFLSLGANYRTQNFVVSSPHPEIAQEVALAAETYRRTLAIEWLAKELPPWREPCPIVVNVGPHLGAGGATSFMFDNGRPFGWSMNIQGSRERLLDSVLPHEVTHTIFATHFGRPLPRWADEGACTSVEHESERGKQNNLLINFLTTDRGIAFNQMFTMGEYPADVLPLYAQGFSLARFLIAQGGKQRFVEYVGDGMRRNNWTSATQTYYGYQDLSELQITWLDWVRRGSPPLAPATHEALAAQPAVAANADLVPGRLVTVAAASEATASPVARQDLAANRDVPRDGWYARVRDQALAQHDRRTDVGNLPDGRLAAARGGVDVQQAVSRPQGLAPLQPVFSEASPAASIPAPPTALPSGQMSPAMPGPGFYAPSAPLKTVWR